MSANLEKQQNQAMYSTLCEIPLIRRMRTQFGIQYLRRLVKVAQYKQASKDQITVNFKNQTYLILLLSGSLQIVYNQKKNDHPEKQDKSKTIHKNTHFVVDTSVSKYLILNDAKMYLVRQKYILELFQGLLEFPYLMRRFKELQKNELFYNLQKRVISKIAFDLQEVNLPIGVSIFPREYRCDNQQTTKYFYFIVSGEIKIFKNSASIRKPICVLGPHQMFGNFSQDSQTLNLHGIQLNKVYHNQDYYGIVVSQTAELYKMKVQNFVKSLGHYIQYENKRHKWRQSRLNMIDQKIKVSNTHRKNISTKKYASFLQKQMAFQSFYGGNAKNLSKMKKLFNQEQIQCQNREQYYGKKLDRILSLQKQRYGHNEHVVLFPIGLDRRYCLPNKNTKKSKDLSRTLTSTPKSLNSTLKTPMKFNNKAKCVDEQQIKMNKKQSKRVSTEPSKYSSGFSPNFHQFYNYL